MTTTRELAQYVHELDTANLPESLRDYAVVLVADALAAGLYGSRSTVGEIVRKTTLRGSASGPAGVWGHADSLDPAAAALVNGTQAHACELDDYFPGGKCHPGAVVVPAALAASSRRRTTGAEFLRAVIAGYEMMGRVAVAAGANATRMRGWHLTGMVGPFGATTAACLLDEVDFDTHLHALGIAGSHAGGLFAFSSSGAMTKRLHAGRAAQAGLLSTSLARDGFTGPPDVLEAPDGGFLWTVSDGADAARLTQNLGTDFVLERTAIKTYSCCGSLHSSIDAVIQLMNENDLSAEDVSSIEAHNASVVEQQCGFAYTGRGGLLEAQMSIQYSVAVAAIDRTAFLEQYSDERIADPQVQDLATRVRFKLDPEIDEEYPNTMPARVTVHTVDGRSVERFVPGPSGSSFAPWGLEEVAGKLRSVSAGVLSDARQDELLALLRELQGLDDVSELAGLLGA